MKDMRLSYTTDGDGAATVYGERAITGRLYAVLYLPGTTDTDADLTLTCEGAAAKPLLTKANAGTADAWFYPRDLVHGVENGATLTGTSGGDRVCPLLAGVPKLAVAQGAAGKSGAVVLFYED
jgi:hypothetical protein